MAIDRDRGRRDDSRSRSSNRGSRFKYTARDPSLAKERADRKGKEFDSFIKDEVKMYTPPEGDNLIRILPPTWDSPNHYGITAFVHYNVGPDNGAYLCLKEMKGEDCPVCEEYHKAIKEGDEKYAQTIKVAERLLVWIVDRDNEDEGAVLWSMSWSQDRDITSRTIDKRTGEVLNIDDPDEGYDVEFTREGKGLKTKYIGLQIARRSSELDNDNALDYIQDNPIPEQLVYYDYDYISKVFSGKSTDGDNKSQTSDTRREDPDDYTYDEIMDMNLESLDDVVKDEKLGIDASKYNEDSLDAYADDVVDALGLTPKKPAKSSGRERLRSMRD